MILPLTDPELWEELALKEFEPNFFRQFERPQMLSAPQSSAVFYKATPGDAGWTITMGSGLLPESPHMLMFADPDGRQFVFLTERPQKLGASYELPVRRAFRSLYVRATPRAPVDWLGWRASEFAVPSDDFDPAQKRPLIETVFHSYTMLLRKGCRQTSVSAYGPDSEPIVLAVRESGRAAYLSDARSAEAYASPTTVSLSGRSVELSAFLDLLPDLNLAEYVRHSEKNAIVGELIVPVILAQTGRSAVHLGYIRARAGTEEGGFSEKFLNDLFEVAEGIPGSLLASNFSILREDAEILDISTGGMALATESVRLSEAWHDSRNFRFDLFTGEGEGRLKCNFQKVHLSESNGRVRVGGHLVSVSAAVPDLTDAQTAGTLMLKKAIRRAHSLASGRTGPGRA